MARRKKKEKKSGNDTPAWMTTFSDMTTLLLTFFVLLYTTATVDGSQLRLIINAFISAGFLQGGNTMEKQGELVEMGNRVEAMPSNERGTRLNKALRNAISQFQPEIQAKKIKVENNERGIVISLSGKHFFKPGSAMVEIEDTKDILNKVATLLSSLPDRKFRIEGHTDSTPVARGGIWESNWELSTARAVNVLQYLIEYGVNEKDFYVCGYADTMPSVLEVTEEDRQINRRVDIVILDDAHL
ncbi:MAG: flagellar motor protein MotB [Spirochaetales bacterium]|nr:flagellar motor protein MotB [Spirochaetales bacterium]